MGDRATQELVRTRADGAGNRFVIVDAVAGPAPGDPAAYARRVAAEDPFRPDGLLVLDRAADGELRMTVYNRDGSRPEACGNGLRCLATFALEAGHAAGPEFTVHTDAGARRARACERAGEARRVSVSMGAARVGARESFQVANGTLHGWPVDVGNPHLVVLREAAPGGDELAELGPRLASDARFPAGTNVELGVVAGEHVVARVWERGVGETAACGSGACALAQVAAGELGLAWPVRVRMPGGELVVEADPGCELWLSGPVETGL